MSGAEAFLREVGALRVTTELPGFFGDLRIFGIGGGPEVAVREAREAMRNAEAWWGHPVVPIVPLIGYGVNASSESGPFGGEGYVLHAQGVHHLYRGALDQRGSFRELVDDLIDEVVKALAARRARQRSERELFGELAGLLGTLLVSHTDVEMKLRGDRTSVVLRVDERGDDPCIRMEWDEPGLDPAALDARNRDARIARGWLAAGVARFSAVARGRGWTHGRLAAALAHDARLPIAVTATDVPTLDELQRALADHAPIPRAERLLAAMLGKRSGDGDRRASRFERRGSGLVGPSSIEVGAKRTIEVTLGVSPEGLVVVEHRPRLGDEALARDAMAKFNARVDNAARACLDDGALCVRLTTTDVAIASGQFESELSALEWDVAALARRLPSNPT